MSAHSTSATQRYGSASVSSGHRWTPVAAGGGAPSGETLPSIDPVTGVWTRDIRKAHQTAASLEAGTVGLICYNSLPRGGFKQNGWGREKGPYGLDLFTQIKSVIIHFT